MKAVIFTFILFFSDISFACKCAQAANQILWNAPHKAKMAMLLKLSSSETTIPLRPDKVNEVPVNFEKRPWTRSSLAQWKAGGTTCDLRGQDDVWYLLVSNSAESAQPHACNSIFSPVSEVPEVVAELSRHWDENQTLPNPAWGVGCKKTEDCVVSASSGCIEDLPVVAKYQKAVAAWRKALEPRMNCVAGAEKKQKVKAICHTGVCELRPHAG